METKDKPKQEMTPEMREAVRKQAEMALQNRRKQADRVLFLTFFNSALTGAAVQSTDGVVDTVTHAVDIAEEARKAFYEKYPEENPDTPVTVPMP